MTRSELKKKLAKNFSQLNTKDIEAAVNTIIDFMTDSLSNGNRIEIRGFGSFCLHFRAPRKARNPKTGEVFHLGEKHVPYFKPGKQLKERVNNK